MEEYSKEICELKNGAINKRLDKLEEIVQVIYSLATDVKLMTQELVSIKCDVKELKDSETEREKKPSKFFDIIGNTMIAVVTSTITVAVLSAVIK